MIELQYCSSFCCSYPHTVQTLRVLLPSALAHRWVDDLIRKETRSCERKEEKRDKDGLLQRWT